MVHLLVSERGGLLKQKLTLHDSDDGALLEVLLLLVILLLLCGNIEHNPGPGIHYPCGICYQPVR